MKGNVIKWSQLWLPQGMKRGAWHKLWESGCYQHPASSRSRPTEGVTVASIPKLPWLRPFTLECCPLESHYLSPSFLSSVVFRGHLTPFLIKLQHLNYHPMGGCALLFPVCRGSANVWEINEPLSRGHLHLDEMLSTFLNEPSKPKDPYVICLIKSTDEMG